MKQSREAVNRILVADLMRRYNEQKEVESSYCMTEDKVYHSVPVTDDCSLLVVYGIDDFLVQMTDALKPAAYNGCLKKPAAYHGSVMKPCQKPDGHD